MKRLLCALLLAAISFSAIPAANDVGIDQRNPTDTGWAVRLLPLPPSDAFLMYNVGTLRPQWTTLGAGLSVSGTTLVGFDGTWLSLSGKPTFATVATSGAYADLSGRPTLATVATTGAYTDLSGRPTIPAAQINSDWNAGSGLAQILNKPSLAAVATSGAYADLSGRPSLATVAISGAYADLSGTPSLALVATEGTYASLTGIPSTFAPSAHTHAASDIVSGTLADARIPSLAISKITGLQTALDDKLTTPAGTTAQYLRGDASLATFPTAVSSFTNDANYVTSSSLTTTLSGYATTSALTSGLAGKFNTPSGTTSQYVRGDGSLATLPAPGTGTVTSVAAGTGLSGGTITTSGTISMPNVGTAGEYVTVTTDSQGRVSAGRMLDVSSSTPTLNSAAQISATRPAHVVFSVDISVTSLLLAGTRGSVYLEYADNVGMSTNLVTVTSGTNSTGGVLNVTNLGTVTLAGFIPAGKYYRIRTANDAGTPSFSARAGQIALF